MAAGPTDLVHGSRHGLCITTLESLVNEDMRIPERVSQRRAPALRATGHGHAQTTTHRRSWYQNKHGPLDMPKRA